MRWEILPGLKLSALKLLPENGEAVTRWSNRDDAFNNICEGVEAIAKEIIKERYKKRLYLCKQELIQTVAQEYPPNDVTLNNLLARQRELGLSDEDVHEIKTPILQKKQVEYTGNLNQYKHQLEAIAQEYPLNDVTLNLNNLLERWRERGLRDEDMRKIAAPIFQEKKAEYDYKQNQYEQELKAIAQEYPLNPVTLNNLQGRWRERGLRDEDMYRVATPILQQRKMAYQAEYREKLKQYRQFFLTKIQPRSFVGDAEREELRQLQQSLRLSDEDVLEAESSVLEQIRLREYLANLKHSFISFLNSYSEKVWLAAGVVAATLAVFWGAKIVGTLLTQNQPSPAQLPATPLLYPSEAQTDRLTDVEAKDLINEWLKTKPEVFGSNYNEQLAAELTAGTYYEGVKDQINKLRDKKSFLKFTSYSIDNLEGFKEEDADQAEIHLKITEDVIYEINQYGIQSIAGKKSQRAWGFGLQLIDGKWKIVCAEGDVDKPESITELEKCLVNSQQPQSSSLTKPLSVGAFRYG